MGREGGREGGRQGGKEGRKEGRVVHTRDTESPSSKLLLSSCGSSDEAEPKAMGTKSPHDNSS